MGQEMEPRTEKMLDNEAHNRQLEAIMREGGVIVQSTDALTDQLASLGRESMDPQPEGAIAVLLDQQKEIAGLDFDPEHGGKKLKRAQLLGQMDQGDKSTGRVEVLATNDRRLNGMTFAMDLSDAPPALQDAVDRAWDTLQTNIAALKGDLPPEVVNLQNKLEPIMRARLANVAVPEPVSAVAPQEKVGGEVIDFPAESEVQYDRTRMNRLPASDQAIFASYRRKGWANLGKRQRQDYRRLKEILDNAANQKPVEAAAK